jgi:hypothetical protein
MTKYRLKPSEIMQDLLDAGAIRPECVDEFKVKIALAKKAENLNGGF